ncbi:MAG: acetyltransferase [Gemmatimonadaceae bacterium]|nr:acetyltransferase [Gemmatimonadaceae bacterium]
MMTTSMPTPIVVYGASGHGREVALLLTSMIDAGAPWRLLGYLDDDAAMHGRLIGDLRVLGDGSYLAARAGQVDVALGIGNPDARRRVVERIRAFVRAFPVLVHPSVPPFARVTLGEGVQIHAGAILTIDIAIGAFSILNRHVDVSHDCRLGDWCTLAPAVTLAGNVHLAAGADLGARATCIPAVRIGAWSVIGAGAVVTRDVPDGVTAVGVPARALSLAS